MLSELVPSVISYIYCINVDLFKMLNPTTTLLYNSITPLTVIRMQLFIHQQGIRSLNNIVLTQFRE